MKISYLGNLTSTFLLLMSFFCVSSAPARPLNERSTEFAWVILDEQQSDNNSSARRKITPKSIFISPSFGTQSCSSGYTLDANGRCIKVVKLDTTAHEQFVLELLSQNFGNYEDYDDEDGDEILPTPGPFQLNIPLNMDAEKDKISIIVAPTNGHFDDTLKIEDKKTSQLDAPLIITKIDISDSDRDQVGSNVDHHRVIQKPNSTSTTVATPSVIKMEDVSKLDAVRTSTLPTTIVTTESDDMTTITAEAIEATTSRRPDEDEEDDGVPVAQEQQAIFFKLPTVKVQSNEESITLTQTTTPTNADDADATSTTTTTTTTNGNSIRFPDRPTFDEALFQDFLQDMKKQVNRRFVTKTQTQTQGSSQEVLYNNHRNRDRWLFPRLLDHEQKQTHRLQFDAPTPNDSSNHHHTHHR